MGRYGIVDASQTRAPADVRAAESVAGSGRSWPRRHRRALLAGVAVLVLLALAAGAGASWYFSSKVVVPDDSPLPPDATVVAYARGLVVLDRSEDTLRPGIYGLEWPGGHAVLEGVVPAAASQSPAVSTGVAAGGADTVTRRLSALRGRLAPGTRVALDNDVYVGTPAQALGLPFTNVRVPDELGPMPAWLIPGARRGRTWAIVVHGINGDREGDLYDVPALHRAGVPALLITYREDAGAPRSPDGLHHMGLTEWRDLQAAARYALAHGARRLVLLGASMGGAIVAQFMERSPLAREVSGVVLDAPALSWKAILSFNATRMGLPSFAALPVEWVLDLRIHPDWASLDALDHPGAFHLPILLFHGLADGLVPISTSDAFATELPRWVTYYRVPYAAHVEAWNVDPPLYERRLDAFLRRVGAG